MNPDQDPREPAQTPALSSEQAARVLELTRGADSVELKVVVPAGGHRATIKALGLDPVEAQPRQAYFFDTPDLALDRAGVIVRARRIQGGGGDTVVKLRPIDPGQIDPELRALPNFKVEVDVLPGGFVCSASFKGKCTGQDVLLVSDGRAELKSLFSKGQRAFFIQHAPAGITLNELLPLGPTFLLKAKHQPKHFARPITVEMWLYPDGARILEVSTKCLPAEAFQAAAEFKAWLGSLGISLLAGQETKTRAALEFFKAGLEREAAEAATT